MTTGEGQCLQQTVLGNWVFVCKQKSEAGLLPNTIAQDGSETINLLEEYLGQSFVTLDLAVIYCIWHQSHRQ